VIAVVAVLVGGGVLHGSSFDLGFVRATNALHTGAIAAVTNAVYRVFSPVEAVALTAVATAIIWLASRDLRPALAFAVVIAVTWLPSAVVKVIVARPRPDRALLPHPFSPAQVDASYPSGHTVFVVAAAIATIALLSDTRAARAMAVIAPIVVVVVVLSLLIDGVHFPTDVLASIVWALGVAPLVRMLWLRWLTPRVPLLR
jgi:undecaprenyl-diphosphatase